MVNGSRYYRALESVSIASALSSALTIYPCQVRIHQTLTVLNSNLLQLGRRSGGRLAHSLPQAVTCQHCDTHYLSRHRTHTTFRLLSGRRRATSSATDSTYWADCTTTDDTDRRIPRNTAKQLDSVLETWVRCTRSQVADWYTLCSEKTPTHILFHISMSDV